MIRGRSLAVVFLVLLYMGATAAAVARAGPHLILELLAAQYLLLLPAIVLYLHSKKGTIASAGAGRGDPVRWFGFRVLGPVYLVLVLALAWWVQGRIATGDESSYLFQAKVFLSGHATAEAPLRLVQDERLSRREFRFHHHIIYRGKWFSKYFPGWPALLAVGRFLSADWLLNPLLSLLVLWLTFRIALLNFDERVARTAVFFLVVSPFFALNSMGFMSHPACATFIAGAALCYFRGVKSGRLVDFTIMLLLILLAGLVRPPTAFFAAFPLGIGALWRLRRQARRMLSLAIIGVSLGAAGGGILLLCNRALTGAYWPLAFALYYGGSLPRELIVGPRQFLASLLMFNRWSLESTMIYAFPFLFLLAAYATVKLRHEDKGVLPLAGLFGALLVGRFVPPGPSGAQYGERLYFETFFAVAILGAAGWFLLQRNWRLSSQAAWPVAACVLGAQIFYWGVFVRKAYLGREPYRQVAKALHARSLNNTLVFMQTGGGFVAQDMNWNEVDWERAPAFYMVDPGPERRTVLACTLNRSRWILVRYDADSRTARVVDGETAGLCAP